MRAPIPVVGAGDGLENNQIVRVSSPGASLAVNDAYARSYDSGDNKNDFLSPNTVTGFTGLPNWPSAFIADPTARAPPRARLDRQAAVGATSPPAIRSRLDAALYGLHHQRHAKPGLCPFSMTGVTTGTWSLVITSGSFYRQIDNVTITHSTGVPNGATSPAWWVSGHIGTMLSSSSLGGYVEGRVTDLANVPLSGITISAGGITKTTGANGTYFAAVSSGQISVIANPNNVNTSYIQVFSAPTVQTGEFTTQNFILIQGGSLSGYITSATTPVPNFVVSALLGGSQYGQAASDSSGHFTIRNLSTGTYQVTPVLLSGQDSNPNFISGTVSSTGRSSSAPSPSRARSATSSAP